MPIIKVENLRKVYPKTNKVAVDGISFEVKKGEVFGILGPNGAGKTTTLEIIECLNTKSEGNVTVCGFNSDVHPSEIKQRIGIQLQSASFYPELSLIELLKLFAGMYNAKIDPLKILEEVNLVDKATSYYEQLSGGQKQRFSIASTLVHTPEIIFLDEPTTGLDPQARRNLWDLVKDLKKKGVTIVLTTHYMDEAEVLCDRLAVMDEGKIVATGTPNELIKNLIKSGFKKDVKIQEANLEDVFISLTGKALRD